MRAPGNGLPELDVLAGRCGEQVAIRRENDTQHLVIMADDSLEAIPAGCIPS